MTAAITVAVLTLFRPGQLAVEPAPHTSIVIQAGTRQVRLLPGQRAGLRMEGLEVDLFALRQTTPARSVRITGPTGDAGEFILSVPGRIKRTYRGVLTVRPDGAMLLPILTIDREQAVWATVAAELTADAPDEAKKAMAVVARSFYAASAGRHRDFDFCDTTHCQFHRSPGPQLDGTAELLLTYNGQTFAPYYSASCGGRTRTVVENGWKEEIYPYSAVPCEPCVRSAPEWQRRLKAKLLAPLLDSPTESTRVGINRKLGWQTIPSNNYTVRHEGSFVELTGRGEGHGTGLCQRGALEMARQGKSFTEILRHYFPGTLLK